MSCGFRLIWGFCVGARQSGVAPPPASASYLLLRYLLILPTHNFLHSFSPCLSSLSLLMRQGRRRPRLPGRGPTCTLGPWVMLT